MIRIFRGMLGFGVLLAAAGSAQAGRDPAAEAVLDTNCVACHERDQNGELPRINAVRKTPEGWQLTIRRMKQWHAITPTPADERTLVKYLSDTQGLAPEEAAPYRAVVERRPGNIETADDADINVYCARCHSYARAALQRRDTAEWVKHVHMHLGQWPTLEYQASGRDREWFKVASTDIAKKLGEKWPLKTSAWAAWQRHKTADLAGTWRLAGHRPGKGDYSGSLVVKRVGTDLYALSYRLTYADGSTVAGKGQSILYTGYEWRGATSLGKDKIREIYEVAADGDSIKGRWFLAQESAIGGTLRGVRANRPTVLAVSPDHLKAGQSARLTVVGAGLSGKVDLGPGITIEKIISNSADTVTVQATAAKDAAVGPRPVAVGSAKAESGLVVYDRVGSVKVEPAFDIARVGANGGPIAGVPAQFEAVAYTADGLRIGVVPASWSIDNFDKDAVEAGDAAFGGRITPVGLFVPAGAGPNPARKGANNAANLTVKAKVTDGTETIEGDGHLIVTLQRWNDAPLR